MKITPQPNNPPDASLLPIAVATGVETFDARTPEWNLLEQAPGMNTRVFRRFIPFEKPFSSPPALQVGLTGFDINNEGNARLRVQAGGISETGFYLEIESWLDTQIWLVEAQWIAFGHLE